MIYWWLASVLASLVAGWIRGCHVGIRRGYSLGWRAGRAIQDSPWIR